MNEFVIVIKPWEILACQMCDVDMKKMECFIQTEYIAILCAE